MAAVCELTEQTSRKPIGYHVHHVQLCVSTIALSVHHVISVTIWFSLICRPVYVSVDLKIYLPKPINGYPINPINKTPETSNVEIYEADLARWKSH